MECWTCRLEGKEAQNFGEKSRSPFQRGKECSQEIMEDKKPHPLVLHFQETHEGWQQEIIMKTVRQTRTALERQVWGSVMIDRL